METVDSKEKDNSVLIMNWYLKSSEKVHMWLLIMWIILPIIMVCYVFIMGTQGNFITEEELIKSGLHLGSANYNVVIKTYYRLFQVVGLLTFVFSVLHLILCRKRVFSKNGILKNRWFLYLLLLFVWAIVSTLLSDDPLRAFSGGNYTHDGFFSYILYASAFLCASTIRKEKYRLIILRLFCSVVSVLALIMVIQELSRNSFLDYCFPSFRAVVFNQFNHFGYVLCMGIIAFWGLYLYDKTAGRKMQIAYLVGFCALVYALLINDTFGAYLATVVATPIIFIFYVRSGGIICWKSFVPLVAFVLISVLSILNVLPGSANLSKNLTQFGTDVKNVATGSEQAASAGTGRFTLWKDTIKKISERPLFGYGPQGFYGKNAITNNDAPHNEYLQMAGFLGIPALLFYLGALFSLAFDHWKKIKELDPLVIAVSGVTVVYLFSAFFGNPFFNTAPFFWMFLGLTTATNEKTPPLISLEDA